MTGQSRRGVLGEIPGITEGTWNNPWRDPRTPPEIIDGISHATTAERPAEFFFFFLFIPSAISSKFRAVIPSETSTSIPPDILLESFSVSLVGNPTEIPQ